MRKGDGTRIKVVMQLRRAVSIIFLGATSTDQSFGMDADAISADALWLFFVSIILLLLSIPNIRLVYKV